MKLDIAEARTLLEQTMQAVGHDESEAAVIADHLLDCELRGLGYAGLARALAIADYIRNRKLTRRPIALLKETAVSAHYDGGDNVGYLVAGKATEVAIAKAREVGMAAVAASKTYYTGMFSYYMERITAAGLVGMAAGSGVSVVAPFGGTEPRFCTNPIAFGFPTGGVPLIWDIGTSSTTHAEVLLAQRLSTSLPAGIAYDSEGNPTTDPFKVLPGGAITAWGGHRGSGLALSIQVLSMMAGQINAFASSPAPYDCGFFLAVFDPALFGDPDDFRHRVTEYVDLMNETRPADPEKPVRVPFARSHAQRAERLAAGWIEVSDKLVETARSIVAGRSRA